MTLTFDIPKEIEDRLLADARKSGVPLPDYIRDFIVEHYQDDLADIELAEARLSNRQTPIAASPLGGC